MVVTRSGILGNLHEMKFRVEKFKEKIKNRKCIDELLNKIAVVYQNC